MPNTEVEVGEIAEAHRAGLMTMDASPSDLPGEWSETGYTLPEDLPYEQWLEVGKSLRSAGETEMQRLNSIYWAIGDWLAYGEHTYGEKWKDVDRLFGSWRSEGTLRQIMYIAKRFQNLDRPKFFPFWHLKPIAQLGSEKQRQEVLAQAADGGWTKRRIQTEVRRLKQGNAEVDGATSTGIVPLEESGETVDGLATVGIAPPEDASCDVVDGAAAPPTSHRVPRLPSAPADDIAVQDPPPRRQPDLAVVATPRWKLTPDSEGVDVEELISRLQKDSLPDSAVCFLRVPPSRLESGLAVMRAWEFDYQTCIAVDLPKTGEHIDSNLWFSAKLDLILIGVRGGLPEVTDDAVMRDRPIDHYVKATLKTKIGKWLPDVQITSIE